eukprot:CAMPEP_0202874706 /NCGR_PEP_ID=MMETSP1391-20130828/25882_1 /ASSEMBLY_ACC=CAM_ASM_000867 /TAXON_ID=1034604 /ORGANISM="Chlamydomonas leiostraca, Strain SAG 11-49" /LENGTH=37 /DNA_ID= /DNA_START= /DNA_END= /DNA_ORIENTATION=
MAQAFAHLVGQLQEQLTHIRGAFVQNDLLEEGDDLLL